MDTPTLLLILIALAAINLIALLILLLRSPNTTLEHTLRTDQRDTRTELRDQLDQHAHQQDTRNDTLTHLLNTFTTRTDQRLETLRNTLSEDARNTRIEATQAQQQLGQLLAQNLNELSTRNTNSIVEMRTTLETRLKELQQDNAAKLEQMRATVDEKLHATLETRLSESFGNVTKMLAQVHQGLGDMSQLASDVGGLQRLLTNVKSRGIFGEVQLRNLLEQVFTPEQYAANIATVPNSNERVEYAIRLPGQAHDSPVWLPIDAKFPREDYERLLDAQEQADIEAARLAGNALERRIREEAKRIYTKYISVPHTTDFAILFLPTESLYAEVLRRPGLFEALQRDHHITIAGPTTLLALLTSLQVGFRTLAISEQSSKVWKILETAKSEFSKFGNVLDSVKQKLDQASTQIENTGVRTRAIERTLREVELQPELPETPLLNDQSPS